MKEDSDRVFDVSKPHKVSPSPTSRPVIVGHHPMTSDPMMTDDADPTQPSTSEHRPIPVFGPDESDTQEHHPEPDENDVSPTLAPEHPESVIAVSPEPTSDHSEPAPDYAEPPAEHHGHSSGEHSDEHESPLQYGGMPHHGPDGDLPPESSDEHSGHHHGDVVPAQTYHHHRRRWPKVLIILLVLLVAGYLAIDSRLIKTSIKLPFHVFKQPAPTPAATATQAPPTEPVSTVPALPSGFANYVLPNTTISFDYPTTWGTPTTTAEGGYSSRSASAKSDGTYAYITNFASNTGVQVVLTSDKYLSPSRTAPLYYDYLQWCTGTNDGLFYKSTLLYNTANGVSTPSTVICGAGPLTDVSKINDTTIVQPKTTNPDGSALGDLYTENLKDTNLPVIRVKDTTSTNSVDIKQLLNTIDLTTPTPTTNPSNASTTTTDTTTGQ